MDRIFFAFDMEIIHKKGKDNVVANALSKKDEEMNSYSVTVVIPEYLDEIRSKYTRDLETSEIINNPSQNSKFE